MEYNVLESLEIKSRTALRALLSSREFRVEEISQILDDLEDVIEDIEMNGLDKDLDGFSFDYTEGVDFKIPEDVQMKLFNGLAREINSTILFTIRYKYMASEGLYASINAYNFNSDVYYIDDIAVYNVIESNGSNNLAPMRLSEILTNDVELLIEFLEKIDALDDAAEMTHSSSHEDLLRKIKTNSGIRRDIVEHFGIDIFYKLPRVTTETMEVFNVSDYLLVSVKEL